MVGPAIQELAAARLGRAFVPLAFLLLFGLGGVLTEGGTVSFLLAVGAPLSAGVMLAFGLRVVQAAFGRPRRTWMIWVPVAAVLPPTYGIWVLAWLGLRRVATADGVTDAVAGAALAGLGFWLLRSWLRIVELHRLAEVMSLPTPDRSEEES